MCNVHVLVYDCNDAVEEREAYQDPLERAHLCFTVADKEHVQSNEDGHDVVNYKLCYVHVAHILNVAI